MVGRLVPSIQDQIFHLTCRYAKVREARRAPVRDLALLVADRPVAAINRSQHPRRTGSETRQTSPIRVTNRSSGFRWLIRFNQTYPHANIRITPPRNACPTAVWYGAKYPRFSASRPIANVNV